MDVSEPQSDVDAAVDPDDVVGGAAPRYMPPMRRLPTRSGQPTPRQARVIANAGLGLTILLGILGVVGVVWAILAVLGIHR